VNPWHRVSGSTSRWAATSAAARLGIIAATLSGLALALHLGGRDGYTVPLTGLLGAPANVGIFGLLSLVVRLPATILSSAGPASEWNWLHLVYCVSIAVNWTLFGLLADLTRPRSPSDTSQMTVPTGDALLATDPLRDEFARLEEQIRERERVRRSDPMARAA
jgi:hypothetical protein